MSEEGEKAKNLNLSNLLKSSSKISLDVRGTVLTKTRPNKLILGIEEDDKRKLSTIRDFFGRIRAKFEQDPFAMVCLLVGGASRITKAVLTNGASELAQLTQ